MHITAIKIRNQRRGVTLSTMCEKSAVVHVLPVAAANRGDAIHRCRCGLGVFGIQCHIIAILLSYYCHIIVILLQQYSGGECTTQGSAATTNEKAQFILRRIIRIRKGLWVESILGKMEQKVGVDDEGKRIRSVAFVDGKVQLIDQPALPTEFRLVNAHSVAEVAEHIKKMTVRGAPAIGAAGGYAMVLAARESQATTTYDPLASLWHSVPRPHSQDAFLQGGVVKGFEKSQRLFGCLSSNGCESHVGA